MSLLWSNPKEETVKSTEAGPIHSLMLMARASYPQDACRLINDRGQNTRKFR
jgi:hypothetical protein